MKPRRYQLNKTSVALARRHPWIFREQMSTATTALADGAWLRLFDGNNAVVGHGIFEAEGAIAIRILRRGAGPPNALWVRELVSAAIARREPLVARTTAMRLVHGENDGLPAVVIDRFNDTLVVQSYSLGADALARYAGIVARRALGETIRNVVQRPARRRRDEQAIGHEGPEVSHFVEDGVEFAVDLVHGQKSGAYLDLRGLRRALAEAPLADARVLNLFSYSGMLGRIVERAGASKIIQVDQSDRAITFAQQYHVDDRARHDFIAADIFDWLPRLPSDEMFDLIVVDPPAMTSSMQQIPTALAAYRKLYANVAAHVRPGGLVVAACCTSRIERAVFHDTVKRALGAQFTHERDLPTELDHPVAFAQGDYLKIGFWRRGQA